MSSPLPLSARARRRLSGLRARVRRRSDAAAAVQHPGRPQGPRRPRHRFVVVITYGRSGSTLVQGLLNTLPRTLVRGENGLYLLSLFRAYDSAVRFRQVHLRHNPRVASSAFYGLDEVRPRSFVRSARALVLEHLLGQTPPEDVDVVGFKEVAWHRLRQPEQADFFDYLDRVLPGCLYVLNERRIDDVLGSGFWKGKDREVVLHRVRRVEEMQRHLRTTRPGRTLDTRYDALTSDDREVSDAQLRALAEFVHGSCDDDLLVSMRATLAVGHGPFPFAASRVVGPAGRRAAARAAVEPEAEPAPEA